MNQDDPLLQQAAAEASKHAAYIAEVGIREYLRLKQQEQPPVGSAWKHSPGFPGLYYYMGKDNYILPVLVVSVRFLEGHPEKPIQVSAVLIDYQRCFPNLTIEDEALWAGPLFPPSRPPDRPHLEPKQ